MNALARVFGIVALILTLAPAILFAAGWLGESPMKSSMLVGAVLWFATAPLFLKGGK